MIEMIIGILAIIMAIIIICAFAWYRIVSPTEAHLVITPTKKMIVSSDESIATNKKKTYFSIPSGIPFIGRQVRIMDLTIKEIVMTQESYEKNQARFNVKSSTKYRISNVNRAAETFDDDESLKKQLQEVIVAGVNAVAANYDVVHMRSKKQEMSDGVEKAIEKDLDQWGLSLINFQLIDFADTEDSKIISDISKRREVEIETRTRQENAEKVKEARIKEADSEEKARTREIAKDQVVAEREENLKQKVAEQEKLAEEKRFEVVRVREVQQAEIDKERAIVKAKQDKETEAILKDKKKLEGEGDRLRQEEIAKGEAAPIREKGFAEAQAKEKLQVALNKFGDKAIMALTAEKIVEMEKAVGVETAKALVAADVKVFAGGGKESENGFDLGKMISSMSVSNSTSSEAILNRLARPNDLGLSALGLKTIAEKNNPVIAKAKTTQSSKSKK